MADERTVAILHTNDFHNHLLPVQAEFIGRRKRDAGENTLLLDAGDAISAGNVGVRIGGEPILELMSDTGYDAMTMGNREFHVADSLLRHKIDKARFPILCANIRYQKESDTVLPVQSSITRTLPNGLIVTIIGVTVPMVTSKMAARVLSSYLFDDPVPVVASIVSKLRDTSDIIVALTHIGIKEDHRLAESVPGLDLIIGGHTHVVLTEPQVVGDVPIVQAGWFGHYLGQIELTAHGSSVVISHSSLTDIRQAKAGRKA